MLKFSELEIRNQERWMSNACFLKSYLSLPLQISSAFIAGCVISTLLTGCSCSDPGPINLSQLEGPGREEIAFVPDPVVRDKGATAVAYVSSLKGNGVKGKVTFAKVPDGVKIIADFDGLSPGKHGFHIHEHGDCGGEMAAAAGAHFNPTNKPHGGPDDADRHVGDLGNLVADEKGHAHYERVDKVISLSGKNSIIGRSIIVHADSDDYKTQPAGASGAKIACGIIEAVNFSK